MFPTCVIFMREVASLSVMFPTGVPLRDDGAILGNASRNIGTVLLKFVFIYDVE